MQTECRDDAGEQTVEVSNNDEQRTNVCNKIKNTCRRRVEVYEYSGNGTKKKNSST